MPDALRTPGGSPRDSRIPILSARQIRLIPLVIEDIVQLQHSPQSGKTIDLLRKCPRVIGQMSNVNRSGRHAGQQGIRRFGYRREMARNTPT